MSVKGDWSRVKDRKQYSDNWERIYGNKKPVKIPDPKGKGAKK